MEQILDQDSLSQQTLMPLTLREPETSKWPVISNSDLTSNMLRALIRLSMVMVPNNPECLLTSTLSLSNSYELRM